MKITSQEGLDDMRNRLEQELAQCQNDLVLMLAYAQNSVHTLNNTINGTKSLDLVSLKDDETNSDECEKHVQQLIAKIILTQQPVASDLRYVSALLHLFSDLERINDQCVDIAEILAANPEDTLVPQLKIMAKQVDEIVSHCVSCAHSMDSAMATAIISEDDCLDECFNACKQALITLLNENRENSENVLNQLMIAKYFERIGDHSVNVAEWVMYYCDGE